MNISDAPKRNRQRLTSCYRRVQTRATAAGDAYYDMGRGLTSLQVQRRLAASFKG